MESYISAITVLENYIYVNTTMHRGGGFIYLYGGSISDYLGPKFVNLPSYTVSYVKLGTPILLLTIKGLSVLLYWRILLSVNCLLYLSKLLSFLEKELGSVDDLFFAAILIIVLFFFNIILIGGVVSSFQLNLVYMHYCTILLLLLIMLPTFMLYNMGFYFIIYIRGGATSLSALYELLLDYINISAFYTRLVVQFVRIVVMGVTYFVYNHLYQNYAYLFVSPNTTPNPQYIFDIKSQLISYIRLIFEIVHTVIIFLMQYVAFCVMLLWLFQFLFTSFNYSGLENNFSKFK